MKVYRNSTSESRHLLLDIYGENDLFGESAFYSPEYTESASALEPTCVMVWTIEEINQLLPSRPRLLMALLQFVIQRRGTLERRIESFALDSISTRLLRALIDFSERFGSSADGDASHISSFTHELLAQYIGTSRELVTEYMKHFRQQSFINYSRGEISLNRGVIDNWLKRADPVDKSA